MHGLLEDEVAEIVALYHEWGEVYRSHRKFAHRGSYTDRVWVSPSSVRRVLAAQGLHLQGVQIPRSGVLGTQRGATVAGAYRHHVEGRDLFISFVTVAEPTAGARQLPDVGIAALCPQCHLSGFREDALGITVLTEVVGAS